MKLHPDPNRSTLPKHEMTRGRTSFFQPDVGWPVSQDSETKKVRHGSKVVDMVAVSSRGLQPVPTLLIAVRRLRRSHVLNGERQQTTWRQHSVRFANQAIELADIDENIRSDDHVHRR